MSFAIASASASSLNVVTASTGPKISSWKIRILLLPAEDGRLEVVAVRQIAVEDVAVAADQQLRALVDADLDVVGDLLELVRRDLRADLRRRVERVALADRRDPLEAAAHELVVDRLLDQRPRRAGADLALVERVQDEPFDGLVEELVVLGHHVGEEDVRRLAAELRRRRDDALGGVLHDQPTGGRLAGERDLRDPLVRARAPCRSRRPARSRCSGRRAGRQIADDLGELQDRPRRRARRLQHACSCRRRAPARPSTRPSAAGS